MKNFRPIYKSQKQFERETPCERCAKPNWQSIYLHCSDCRNAMQAERIAEHRVVHADTSNDAFSILPACGISGEGAKNYYFAEDLAAYKEGVHAMNRCRNCEQILTQK